MRTGAGGHWNSGTLALEDMLDGPLLEKLGGEIERYHDKDFLKATMAVCALTAMADDEVKLEERLSIAWALKNVPAFAAFDVDKAMQILDDYISGLADDRVRAKEILYNKVRRMAGDRKLARTLMRVAYLIIASDYDIDAREIAEFRRLCGALDLDAEDVWRGTKVLGRAGGG